MLRMADFPASMVGVSRGVGRWWRDGFSPAERAAARTQSRIPLPIRAHSGRLRGLVTTSTRPLERLQTQLMWCRVGQLLNR